uniref:Uncharacterized protein n=1 Tax=Blidingia minima TaxID=63414 RepID=A0A8E5N7I7_9CHLO|nr:hypothetical protein [Blidingia minima]
MKNQPINAYYKKTLNHCRQLRQQRGIKNPKPVSLEKYCETLAKYCDYSDNQRRLKQLSGSMQQYPNQAAYLLSVGDSDRTTPLKNRVENQELIVVQDFENSFDVDAGKKNLTKKYVIILVGGIILGIIVKIYLPVLLKALAPLFDYLKTYIETDSINPLDINKSNNENEKPAYGFPYGPRPDKDVTMIQVIVFSVLRALFLYWQGDL